MKYFLSITAFLMLIICSCKKDDDTTPTPVTASGVSSTVSSGTWRVTNFNDSGNDETAHFTNYVFSFNNSGVITAVNGGNTVTGIWSTGTDNSKVKFNIGFSAPDDFEELSEDWEVMERTDTKIRLRHISGGNGGTDLLTFEKIG